MMEQMNFGKMNGVVPAVVQHADTGTVLMVGFMNEEALNRTLHEQQAVFWSRSKGRLWKKGETSGNFLDVVSVQPDCDNDALLVEARPRGPVCHTGRSSCFGDNLPASLGSTLDQLGSIIQERAKRKPSGSYTVKLMDEGVARIAQKVGEEAVELAIASQHADRGACVRETADLVYHLLVLLEARRIGAGEIADELRSRMKE